MTAHPPQIAAGPMSVEAFFAFAERRPEKYELVDGVPRVQPWVKRSHSRIASNLGYALRSRLERDHYTVHQGSFAVRTGPASIRFADVMVEPAGGPGGERTTEEALLLVEVLSVSTADVDFGKKRVEYLSLPSLDTYLVVAQDQAHVWQWTRAADGSWPDAPLLIAEGAVELAVFGVALPLAEIYRDVIAIADKGA